MSSIAKKRDLNAGNIDKETWNRQDHILRLFSYWQTHISFGDIQKDLEAMYQGIQGFLDLLTPDFEETQKNEQGMKVTTKGRKTKLFADYRKRLDQAHNLANLSQSRQYDPETRVALRNSSYKKFQELKYDVFQEAERLGYNAKRTDTSEAYREGNN